MAKRKEIIMAFLGKLSKANTGLTIEEWVKELQLTLSLDNEGNIVSSKYGSAWTGQYFKWEGDDNAGYYYFTQTDIPYDEEGNVSDTDLYRVLEIYRVNENGYAVGVPFSKWGGFEYLFPEN